MGQTFTEIKDKHRDFIARQKIFFVATATAESSISLSPKGLDSLRVLGPNRVVWLNLTGSGNETAAHVQINPRMTIMLTAFEGNPVILRVYGTARVIHAGDLDWDEMVAYFPDIPGPRQVFDVTVERVQTSCGFGTPLFDYVGERNMLDSWAEKKGPDGIRDYWEKSNQTTIDGIPTHIVEKGSGHS